jgi:hypothetical protein
VTQSSETRNKKIPQNKQVIKDLNKLILLWKGHIKQTFHTRTDVCPHTENRKQFCQFCFEFYLIV